MKVMSNNTAAIFLALGLVNRLFTLWLVVLVWYVNDELTLEKVLPVNFPKFFPIIFKLFPRPLLTAPSEWVTKLKTKTPVPLAKGWPQ